MPVLTKRKLLLFWLLCLAATLLFATGLPGLQLQPGIPLPDSSTVNGSQASLPALPRPAMVRSPGVFAGLVLALILVIISYRLLSGVPWKEVLDPFLGFALFILVIVLLMMLPKGEPWTADPSTLVLPPPEEVGGEAVPLGTPPWFFLWLVWGGLTLGIALLGVLIYRTAIQQKVAPDPLLQEAENALSGLRSGLDFRNVILNCYLQMSQALQAEQGIVLSETMTAREFERLLEAKGMPHEPVHRLTGLFEAARYGNLPAGPAEERQAVACLSAIIEHSRKGSTAA